ncbi:MAG: hypothetical protein KDI64_20015, partial [Candidatus Accumulibacter sp.]|nr:hypothetical protein [Accumulibacter sp.]
MFKTILRWLGFVAPPARSMRAPRQLDELAPLRSAPEPEAAANPQRALSFVCRQEILDRREQIAGYQFSLTRDLQSPLLEKSARLRKVHDDTLLHSLSPLAASSMLGERFALVRLSAASLSNPRLTALANRNVVIMLTAATAVEADLAALRVTLQRLQDVGVKHGWSIERPFPGLREFLAKATLVEIDTTAFDGMQLKEMCSDLPAARARPALLASQIQSVDDFSHCYHSGFDYFSGPFVCSHQNWHPPKSEVNRLLVFEVLNMIRSGSEFGIVANRLRNDPILTFKLLRYINSPGIGMLKRIDKVL